jgi:hypothetical protein
MDQLIFYFFGPTSWPLLQLLSLCPAAIAKSFSTVKAFYGVGPSTPRQTPDLEGQV